MPESNVREYRQGVPFRAYTNEERSRALAVIELNQGNMIRAARELGIPRATLYEWWDAAREARDEAPRIDRNFANLWADALHECLDLITEKIPNASFRDLSVFASIAADKHLDYSQGRKGSTTNVNVNNDNRTQVQANDVILNIIAARAQATQAATALAGAATALEAAEPEPTAEEQGQDAHYIIGSAVPTPAAQDMSTPPEVDA